MSAHTPGPWEVRHGRSAHVAIYIAGTTHNVAVGVALKDAHLIAAAPKLAEALQSLLAFHEPDSLIDQATDPRLRDAHADAWAEARAALAEAGVQS